MNVSLDNNLEFRTIKTIEDCPGGFMIIHFKPKFPNLNEYISLSPSEITKLHLAMAVLASADNITPEKSDNIEPPPYGKGLSPDTAPQKLKSSVPDDE